ncbi:cupin domain-containing protein [Kitasatospora paranensis]|uniref:Cupin domain-containing protein n=2 Tax=Kitasatospora paranensis TaxID=258053 RepID=A0ABW2FXA3_9ACTN
MTTLPEETLMPVIRPEQAVAHEAHGARFLVHAAPATGARTLRAWRLEISEGVRGVAHTISHEEVFHLLAGAVTVSIDGDEAALAPGDTAVAPAGSALRIDNPGPGPAAVWVTTTAGLSAELPDGTTIRPPWAA